MKLEVNRKGVTLLPQPVLHSMLTPMSAGIEHWLWLASVWVTFKLLMVKNKAVAAHVRVSRLCG